MPITNGSRLGPYEVLAPIGAGGMGEVYKARDTRLGRDVAIKVLAAHLSSSPEGRQRFEREAKTISALSHPHICALYDVGNEGGVEFLVMEYLEGETLASRLARAPLPLDQLLRFGIEIADALDTAHRRGIVHRDLKPGNVLLTKSGVKLLDFGLARLVHPDRESALSASALPTEAPALTAEGTILGTVQYMAPEQLEGKEADARTDIFAFGSTLYEMATGERAFQGTSQASLITAIMSAKPRPISAIQTLTPPALDHVVDRCLAKDPEERWQSIKDAGNELRWILQTPEPAPAREDRESPARLARREWLGWSVAGLLLVAGLIAFAAFGSRRAGPGRSAVRFAVPIPPGTTYAPSEVSRGFSVSPDGTRLVIEAVSKGRRHLYQRRIDSEETTQLEGSLDATAHFWSPDGRFIAFYADGKLKKIPAEGGRPEELCDAPFATVGAWSPNGTILFTGLDPPGIYRVADSGGRAVRVVPPGVSGQPPLWPQFLPDGRRFLYLAGHAGAGATDEWVGNVQVASLDSKENRVVARLESRFEYVPPGYLLYVRDGALFAQPFDEGNAKLRGEPRLLVPNVHYFYGPRHAAFSASRTGVLAYQTAARPSRLVWLDRAGKETGQLGEAAVVKGGLRISRDGARVAVDIENPTTGTSDIWVFEPARGVATRLHSDPIDEVMPVWSADGSKVLYRSDRHGPPDIYEITVDVPGSERPLLALPGVQQPEDVSADGRLLAYLEEVATTTSNIWLLPLQGNGKPSVWSPTRFDQTSPRFSPDGRWIAYESDESGDPEVYVALTRGGGEKRRISPAGGRLPRWRRDGKELYYVAPTGTVMAVSVSPGSTWEAGLPALLFRVEPEIQNYDVTPDGSRFLVCMPTEKVRESPLHVILDWPAIVNAQP